MKKAPRPFDMKQQPIFAALLVMSLAPAMAQEKPIAAPPIPNQAETEAPESGEKAKPVQATPVEETKTAASKEYVVQSGDNPWTIAKNHGVSLQALLEVNDIKDAKSLKIGDVLKLPAGVESKNEAPAGKPAAEAAKKAEEPKEGDDWQLYTIEEGDNPWKIAKAMGIEHTKILKLNEGLDFTKLNVGQQIKVPKK